MRGALIVDGYNLLLALAARERVDPTPAELRAARGELRALLAEWSALRGADVVLVWDGRAPHDRTPAPAGVRELHAEPPAEADDLVVRETERIILERRDAQVATRDRGLLARLPRAARAASFDELAADLEALRAEPMAAPHLHGPTNARRPAGAGAPAGPETSLDGGRSLDDETSLEGEWSPGDETPAGEATPIDTARLPRRRVAPPPLPPAPPARPAPPPRDDDGADAEAAGRAAARAAREARRAKFLAKQKRRPR
ncbi:MAG TPA: NYN domain-containing protein [Acidobacteriota bacterium]|nr:NYN domain-containing protein [Acidobacteriota bacterium]